MAYVQSDLQRNLMMLRYRPWTHDETRYNPVLPLIESQDEQTVVGVDLIFDANDALPESTMYGPKYRTVELM